VSFDIAGVLARSDIFVLSSLWEGLPLVAVEAMAAARPVVLSDVGGNRDLIDHGVQGLLVPPGDAAALAAALLELLADNPRLQAMGLAGRERVRHDFALETMARRYEDLYTLISNAQARLVIDAEETR
jgi:glycosyltransferase involved in cell wall biosynthesis